MIAGRWLLQAFREALASAGAPKSIEGQYANLLRQCRDLGEAKRLHCWIRERGHGSSTYVSNMIVQMYGKCGSVDDAWIVFSSIQARNVFSWNMIIAAFAQNGHPERSVALFWRMIREEPGIIPTRITFLHALEKLKNLAEGRKIHELAITVGLESDPAVGTAIVTMYGKSRSLADAKRVFDQLKRRDVVAWTALITAYTQNGHCEEALDLYSSMDPDGVAPNQYTFTIVIDACAELGRLDVGIAIHARITAAGLESWIEVANSLINLYGNCKRLRDAERIFQRMPRRSSVSWNSMIAAYAHNGHPGDAIDLYKRMRGDGSVKLDPVTFVNVLGACYSQEDLAAGRSIHRDAIARGLGSHLVLASAAVSMYGRCGSVEESMATFERMEIKDGVAWSAVIAALAQNGESSSALHFYRRMIWSSSARPNEATFISVLEACSFADEGIKIHQHIVDSGIVHSTMISTAIFNMYAKCGRLDRAREIFSSMRASRGSFQSANDVSWMNMISALARHGSIDEALELFREMRLEGGKPSEIVFISILHGCSHSGTMEQGLGHFLAMIQDHGLAPRVEHYGCLIDLLGRGGHLDLAQDLVDQMPFEPDARAWSNFLGSCRLHSDRDRAEAAAIRVFELEPEKAAIYVSLSGMCFAEEDEDP
ncbi:pentatricopeptide repeat-containing protein At1g15510, chloroplastic [Selaginella moellendorffii]|nr:pentatricopeptide repeat-containing protein At1g15510, chloroplastic [Selaginella moellendorffii]|eukprot:XP_002972865.2 pentatricopeptide repeat-containing protein At1g15510, chloroplastic [Selaginella moellendorffii]